MAGDFLVFLRRKWKDWDEAQCEPGPARDAARRPVTAVAALRGDVFGALEVVGEFLCAECYAKCHG